MMKMLHIALAATALLAGAATAGPIVDLHATAQQMDDVEGTYQLANGQRARVFALDQKLYVEVGRHRKELVLTGPDQFTSRDGSISMRFPLDAPGERIVLGYRRDTDEPMPVLLAAAQRRGRGSID